MTEKLLTILDWFNLLDNERHLSITNAAVIALVVKMLVSPNLDWPSITGMVVVFANYMHKRQTSDGAAAAEETEEMKKVKAQYEAAVVAQAKAINDIQSKITSISQIADLSKMLRKP